MIKIEAVTLEDAYRDAAAALGCSVTEMAVEVVQVPSSGFLGLFKKSAIIVATIDKTKVSVPKEEKKHSQTFLNETIIPESFVSGQDEEEDFEEELEEELASGLDYTADYDDLYDEENLQNSVDENSIDTIAVKVEKEINELFKNSCFHIDKIEVLVYDTETLLIEFKGEDAALLIGKEGYRYKALSYMLFNWINAKYGLQLRLEIAEFLKNQEESVGRYLESVFEAVERDGRAQTKILDGVLIQIALKSLRERYPQKYVVIRSTRDGLKYILINDYHLH